MKHNEYSMMQMNCEDIGRALACSDDSAQATVINAMAKELAIICRDEEINGMQVCYMAKRLDGNGKKFIEALHQYIDLQATAEAAQ